MATLGTRTPSVGSILDLAIEAGWPALPLTFARACPAPFHPPRIGSPCVNKEPPRQADPTPRRGLLARVRCTGKMRLPTSATDLHHEHPRVIARFSNHRPHGFRRRPRLPCRLPGRNLGRQHDRAKPRLTPRLKLRHGLMNILGLPGIQAPPGPDELLTELSGRRSFLSALSALSEGHRPASDALCRAPAAGHWVLTPITFATRAPRAASVRGAVKRCVLHRPRAPSIAGAPDVARLRDASPGAAADFCNRCDPRAQPRIT
jgi:hypothetical protein